VDALAFKEIANGIAARGLSAGWHGASGSQKHDRGRPV
jgi:hypothetical protein